MSRIVEAKLRLVVAAIVLLFTIVALFTINTTLAWFAENDTATANNMQVSVKSFPSLIIAKTAEEIAEGKLQFEVSFKDASRLDMIAVTHDDAIEGTYLKYVTNHYAVSDQTGIAKPGHTLEFASVPLKDNEQYFVDCTVLLASISSPLEASSLVAKLVAMDDSYLVNSYMCAISIDFYVGEVSAQGYRGTTSLAEAVDPNYQGINLFESGDDRIPLNTEGYITVIMRCYFDGALLDSNGNAYINSFKVKSEKVLIGVNFTASEETAEQ